MVPELGYRGTPQAVLNQIKGNVTRKVNVLRWVYTINAPSPYTHRKRDAAYCSVWGYGVWESGGSVIERQVEFARYVA